MSAERLNAVPAEWYAPRMALRLEEDHPSIVIAGAFDPRLLHPQWFRAEGLLGKDEADGAEFKVVHPGVTEWSTDELVVQVMQNRFSAQAIVTSAAEQVRDLVLGVLKVLDKVPATAIGVNRSMHFDVGGEANWHRVGDTLAPKAFWKKHLEKPGLLTLQMVETTRRDTLPGRTVVAIQPSIKYPFGVFFDFNSEIATKSKLPEPAGAAFSAIIENDWRRMHDEAKTMAEGLLGDVLA